MINSEESYFKAILKRVLTMINSLRNACVVHFPLSQVHFIQTTFRDPLASPRDFFLLTTFPRLVATVGIEPGTLEIPTSALALHRGSGQLHALAALLPGKEALLPIG
jgi:hypothetical protein